MIALLLFLMAPGEMAVGMLIAAYPAAASLLLGAPIEGPGLLVVRMLGVAVLAIGLSWWLARRDPAARSRQVPGFLVYNFGVGALFAWAAIASVQPFVPWILAVVHVGAGAIASATVSRASPA